jgi:glutamate dehydrogenase/leucine dehydrogenase
MLHQSRPKSNFCNAACDGPRVSSATWTVRGWMSHFVSGLGRKPGEAGGDPAPKTALGVFLGLKAAVKFRFGRSELQGLSVAVQGLGGVGYHLCRVAREYNGGATEVQVTSEIHGIPGRLMEIFERARRDGRATNAVANQMARERIGRGETRLVA